MDVQSLTKDSIGKKVQYIAYDGATPEVGVITSYNDKYVFVDYSMVGRGQATPPSKLKFLKDV